MTASRFCPAPALLPTPSRCTFCCPPRPAARPAARPAPRPACFFVRSARSLPVKLRRLVEGRILVGVCSVPSGTLIGRSLEENVFYFENVNKRKTSSKTELATVKRLAPVHISSCNSSNSRSNNQIKHSASNVQEHSATFVAFRVRSKIQITPSNWRTRIRRRRRRRRMITLQRHRNDGWITI